MEEKSYPVIEIHLPVRVEYPSTSTLGRIWQSILSRMGLLLIHSPGMTPSEMLALIDDKLSRSLYTTSIDCICREPEIKITKSHRMMSATEEIIQLEFCRGTQPTDQVTWHLTWLGAELLISAHGPLQLVYPAIDAAYSRAYFLICNVS